MRSPLKYSKLKIYIHKCYIFFTTGVYLISHLWIFSLNVKKKPFFVVGGLHTPRLMVKIYINTDEFI